MPPTMPVKGRRRLWWPLGSLGGRGGRPEAPLWDPAPSIWLRICVIFPCWFQRESITTGNMFILSRGLKQMEVSFPMPVLVSPRLGLPKPGKA